METLNNITKLRNIIKFLVRNLGILEKSEAECCGTTLGQCNAVVEIGRASELSLNELAEILNLDNSTTSRTVNALVNQEIAERQTHPEDRRYLKIKLTERGEEMFNEIEKNMNTYFEDVYEAIPEDKREQVIESLELLLKAIGNNKCC